MFPKYGVIIWSIMEIWPFACIKRNSILTSHTRWIHKKVQAIESNLNSTGDGSVVLEMGPIKNGFGKNKMGQ